MAYTFKHGDRPLEGYTIQRGIGRGGFGEVYYAVSDGGREVALKYLRDNSDVELRGVSHCINLKSPHLVSIFDVKKNAGGEYFIIMEHIAGPALSELLIAEPNGLGKEKAAFFLREIGKGLSDLHDRGIVHRDMKPANIFYEDGHVKIGDYGLSKFISVSRHSAQTTSIGTVHYMAPEVGSGNYHRGIDIYALGVILYEMLLGRVPFEGSSMGEVLMKHLTEQPEVAGLPEPFGKVIRKALEKDPKDRYQNVNEMIDDMLEVGDVRDSLAGFNPNTITVAPRRSGGERMRTPVPSPNPVSPRAYPPPPPPVNPADAVYVGGVPDRVGKRLDRINEKVSRKMDKLAGRPHRRRRHGRSVGGRGVGSSAGRLSGFQGVVLSLLITTGVGIGVGSIIGSSLEDGAVGAGAGLMIVGSAIGVRLSRRVLRWLSAEALPNWVERLVTVGCCALPMVAACGPLTDAYGGDAFVLLVAMMGVVVFCDLDSRFEGGAAGELSFGRAFTMGLFGFIAASIFAGAFGAGSEENFGVIGGAVSASLSLLLEALAWCRPGVVVAGAGGVEEGSGAAREPRPGGLEPSGVDARIAQASRDAPFGIPVEAGIRSRGYVSSEPLSAERSVVSRGAWSLFAFVMLGASVFCILNAALVKHAADEHIGLVAGATGCAFMMVFALQKLTTRERPGFWQETLCPFLMVPVATGWAAVFTFLVIEHPRDVALAAALTGLIAQSVMLVSLLASRIGLFRYLFGRGGADRKPFVMAVGAGGSGESVNIKIGDDDVDVSFPGMGEERGS